jgi:hypothetical protein
MINSSENDISDYKITIIPPRKEVLMTNTHFFIDPLTRELIAPHLTSLQTIL